MAWPPFATTGKDVNGTTAMSVPEPDDCSRRDRGLQRVGHMDNKLSTGDITMERMARTHSEHPSSRTRISAGCAGLLGALLLVLAAPIARAQSQPLSLTEQLDEQLGLGDFRGCFDLLRLTEADVTAADGNPQTAVNRELNRLEAAGHIGNELRAICGPSAVNSASSLGGALNTVQATKTVSQFRLARRRIDQRLPRRPSLSVQGMPLMLLLQSAGLEHDPELRRHAAVGAAVFGEVEYEQQDREITRYEDGYEADITGGAIGMDYAWDRAIVGAWAGYKRMDGDFQGGFVRFLSNPAQLSAVCGGVLPGGDFDLDGGLLGVFAGWKMGDAGFVDVNASKAQRDYRYNRNTCAIESNSESLSFNEENGELSSDGIVIDDIYAGRVSGDTTVTETGLSIRAGFDAVRAAWTFGPRATLSYARSTVDAYSETGRSTVSNPVEPVGAFDPENPNPQPDAGRIVNRALGDPLGLELAYQEQKQDSLLLEVGGLVERRFEMSPGLLVAHASAYWRHQFRDDLRFATARFVQDQRPDPVYFSFVTGQVDANSALFTLGVTALFNERAAFRLEVTHLAFDRYLDSTAISAQFRVGL